MVLRPCARPPKQPMVLGGPSTWFKNRVWGDVVMFVPNKIENNKKYKIELSPKKCWPCTWF